MNPAQLLNATIHGDGPNTVVFGNGFATTQRSWDAVVAELPHDWRVIRFDFVGTTPATTPHWIAERYASYEGHADDLVRLLAFLDVRDAVFVGHSMSGMVSALAACRAPERLSHLLMVGASACYIEHEDYHGGLAPAEAERLLAVIDADLTAWMAGFSAPLLGPDATALQVHACVEAVRSMRPDIGRTMLHSIFRSDLRGLLGTIPASITLVHAEGDPVVPLTAAQYLAEHTRCTGFHVLPISGHLPHVTHPQLLLPIVRATLETHMTARARSS